MDINYKIKERLNEALKVRGMTAAELAAKSGLNKSSVSRYLSGEVVVRGGKYKSQTKSQTFEH